VSLTPHHLDSLASESRALLAALAERDWAADFYLAGSAALALYTGHRPVRGLDLMAGTNRLASPDRRDLLADLLEMDDGFRVETARDGYLYVRSGGSDGSDSSDEKSGVGVKLFYYPYPLIAPFEEVGGFAVASPEDLGLMKIAAIISRGTKRDFADLHLLCRHLPLADLLARSQDKFGHVRDFELQALKGLADLDQTAGQPMPKLAVELGWGEVVAWVEAEVRELGRWAVGLG